MKEVQPQVHFFPMSDIRMSPAMIVSTQRQFSLNQVMVRYRTVFINSNVTNEHPVHRTSKYVEQMVSSRRRRHELIHVERVEHRRQLSINGMWVISSTVKVAAYDDVQARGRDCVADEVSQLIVELDRRRRLYR